MRFLLDTHAFLWTLCDAKKLSKRSRDIIENSENDVFISVITYWEISLKFALGKLKLTGFTPEQLPGLAAEIGLETLPLSAEISSTFYQLPVQVHRDPFDRMLIWQSIREDLCLLSRDAAFKEYRDYGIRVIW